MFTLEEIKKAIKRKPVPGDEALAVTGVSINSRTMKRGSLFIAVKGDRFDGHDFIDEVIKKGAAVILVSREIPFRGGGGPCKIIKVRDTVKALGRIAAWHRQRFAIPIIAVTGSAGKTTTKEMIAAVLASKFRVLKNFKTENNHYGVPLTVLQLNKSHQIAVLELGTNQKGDIAYLSQIVCPTIAVFTNIGASHLAGLNSPAGVFQEKWQMVKSMPEKGVVIYNKEDFYLQQIANKKISQRKISYGYGGGADYQAKRISQRNKKSVQFQCRNKIFSLKTPAYHNIANALIAIICGQLNNITYNTIITIFSKFKWDQSRQAIYKVHGLWVIDDTYNANPVSFASALQTLARFKTRGQKILVCGGMAELGARSKEWHQWLGKEVAAKSINVVIGFGPLTKDVMREVKKNKDIKAFHYQKMDALLRCLTLFCLPGDVLLIKGSRCTRMERVVDFLKQGKEPFTHTRCV